MTDEQLKHYQRLQDELRAMIREEKLNPWRMPKWQ
jgi:hypothetical protein